MPWTCFSYEADVPSGTETRDAAQSTPPGLRRLGLLHCFSYPGYMPPGASNRTVARSTVQACARQGWLSCFRY